MVKEHKSGRRYYETWYEPGLERLPGPLAQWIPDQHAAEQRDRCLRARRIAIVARSIPRRLGQAATPQQLAADKKFWARAAPLYRRMSMAWERDAFGAGDFVAQASREEERAAYTMLAADFAAEAIAAIQEHRTTAITLTAQCGHRELANRMAYLYQRELEELQRLLA